MIDRSVIEDLASVPFVDNAGGHEAFIEYCVATLGRDRPDVVAMMNLYPELLRSLASSGVDVGRAAEELADMAGRPKRRRRLS